MTNTDQHRLSPCPNIFSFMGFVLYHATPSLMEISWLGFCTTQVNVNRQTNKPYQKYWQYNLLGRGTKGSQQKRTKIQTLQTHYGVYWFHYCYIFFIYICSKLPFLGSRFCSPGPNPTPPRWAGCRPESRPARTQNSHSSVDSMTFSPPTWQQCWVRSVSQERANSIKHS